MEDRRESVDGRKARGEATRAQLIARARAKFADEGFAGTRFDAVGAELGMTAGAMYHHFRDKRELFREAVRQCHSEIARKVAASAGAETDWLEGIVRGCLTFIAEAAAPEYFRLVLIDSVSVLGWEEWKRIDAEFSEKALGEALDDARNGGLLPRDAPIQALARLISGGTNELALWAHSQMDRASAMKSAERALRMSIGAWRPASPKPSRGTSTGKRRKK